MFRLFTKCVPFIAFTTLAIKVQQREGCCVVNTDTKEVVNMIAENIDLLYGKTANWVRVENSAGDS